VTEDYPLTGYTDTGETPHPVARLHPAQACCGQPLAYIPLVQKRWPDDRLCRKCRRSDVTPLPHDHNQTEEPSCPKRDDVSSAPPAHGASA
jgi:hypothetical protein